MIGKVYYGIFVGNGVIGKGQSVFLIKAVINGYRRRSGKILLTVRACVTEYNVIFTSGLVLFRFHQFPYAFVVAHRSAVKSVVSVVFEQFIFRAVKSKPPTAYSVGETSYKGALGRNAVNETLNVVIA